jgi:hypothetical protein
LRNVSAPLAEVSRLGEIKLDAAGLTQAARLELAMTLRTGNGVYSNRWSFWAYPPAGRMPAPATPVVSNLRWEGLRRAYPWIQAESGSAASGELLITDALDHDAMTRLRAGGRVWLMLDDSAQRRGASFFPASGGAMGTLVADHPALAGFPHEDFCDLQFYNLLEGAHPLPVDHWPSSLSPIIGGIRTTSEFLSKTKALSRVAYAAEANVGEGKLLVTTLRLRPRFDEAYPEVMSALQSLLRYAAGRDFHPAGQLSEKDLRRLIAE